jgi:hypothetical protein
VVSAGKKYAQQVFTRSLSAVYQYLPFTTCPGRYESCGKSGPSFAIEPHHATFGGSAPSNSFDGMNGTFLGMNT